MQNDALFILINCLLFFQDQVQAADMELSFFP